jgi:nicotinamidase/pyrazinamidase
MKALIVVDVQNDFLPGGALEVKYSDQIIPVVNQLLQEFEFAVATQDWHPSDHKSFASNHEDKKPGDQIILKGLDQILWPDHCVQGSFGARLSKDLNVDKIERVFVKGTDPDIDSYSGFFDNGHLKSTGLSNYLHEKGVEEVYIAGLAADYCVKFTALDSVREGFETYLVADATMAVNLQEGDFEKAIETMENAGVKVVSSMDLIRNDLSLN